MQGLDLTDFSPSRPYINILYLLHNLAAIED